MPLRGGWAAVWVLGCWALACDGDAPEGVRPGGEEGTSPVATSATLAEGSGSAEGSAAEASLPGQEVVPAATGPDGTGLALVPTEGSGQPAGPWHWPEDFQLDPAAAELDPELGQLVIAMPEGFRIVLTLDPDLQTFLTEVVERYDEPSEAVVVVEPSTGRILAWVEDHNDVVPAEHPLQNADPYAASIFKIVTATALVEEVNLGFDRQMCVPPGSTSVEEADLVADQARDTRCVDFIGAMSESVNAYFARLAIDHLTPEMMRAWLERFGFNVPIPFEIPVSPSTADVPEDRLERARMAAGFRHVHLSPLHAALIAASVANDGLMMQPTLVDRVLDPSGAVVEEHQAQPWRQVMSAQTAQTLTRVLGETTVTGTASRYFAEREGWPADLRVAGKTGTLSNRTDEAPNPDPLLMYSWFVGFAPLEDPEMAVSSLVTNTERWYIKGSYLASEAIMRLLRGPGRQANHH